MPGLLPEPLGERITLWIEVANRKQCNPDSRPPPPKKEDTLPEKLLSHTHTQTRAELWKEQD